MVREKTELERSESYQDEAKRLRYALHIVHGLLGKVEVTEAMRVAWCAMRGELHGHEMVDPKREPGGYGRVEHWDY